MNRNAAPLLALSFACLSLAACASSGPPRRGAGGPAGGGPLAAGPRVFISPAGEPFRGPEPMRAWFDGADADHDGAITRAEFRADHERFFKRVDSNGDGAVAGPEVTRYEQEIAPEILSAIDRGLGGEGGPRMGGRGGPPGGGRRGPRLDAQGEGPPGAFGRGGAAGPGGSGGERGGRGGPFSLLNEPEPIRAADADLDFRVTLAEWRVMADRRFDLLDADHDGRMRFEELKVEAPPQAQRGRGSRGLAPPRGGR